MLYVAFVISTATGGGDVAVCPHMLRLRALPRRPAGVRGRYSAISTSSSRGPSRPESPEPVRYRPHRRGTEGRRQRALPGSPGHRPLLLSRREEPGINEYDSGRSKPRAAIFEDVLKLAPADEIANLYLGRSTTARSGAREALPALREERQPLRPGPAWTLHYGRCLLDAGRTKQAVSVLERIPESAGAEPVRGGSGSRAGRGHAEAARLFGAARRSYKDPTRPATTRRSC